jgi:hypothetical protein
MPLSSVGSMKAFISWSGSQSKELGEAIRDWIPAVLQAVNPYFTPSDIEKGTRWSNDIAKELEASSVGIFCITRENIRAPWILFEAGALSKSLGKSHVCPILFGVSATDIEGPLKQFQCTSFDKGDVRQLITTINGRLEDGKLAQKTLETVFDKWWPDLSDKVSTILGKEEAPAEPIRPDRELLEEILVLTRGATASSRNNSLNRRALVDMAENLIMVHNQQVYRQGSYQDALDILKGIHGPLCYLIRHLGREGDGINELLARLMSLQFIAAAESAPHDEFLFSERHDEEVPF